MLSKKASLIIGGILGIGAPTVTASYYKTNLTVWDILKDDVIPNNPKDTSLEGVWIKLEKKLSQSEDRINDKELKLIKEGSNSQEIQLKNWCFKKYKSTYKVLGFHRTLEEDLNEIKSVCSLKIKDQIVDSEFLEVTEAKGKDRYKEHLNTLKTYKNEKLNLDKKLLDLQIKVKTKEEEEQWQELRDWCKESYERGFQGNESDLWKLLQKFCKV